MTIQATLFQYAPEFITVDAGELARIDLFIADATRDEEVSVSDGRYERLVALRTAALMTDSNGSVVSPTGFGKKREKTSEGEVEYQTSPTGSSANYGDTNKYWIQYYRLKGLAGASAPMVLNGCL